MKRFALALAVVLACCSAGAMADESDMAYIVAGGAWQGNAVMCDPNVDSRGFVFRVYAYRQHAAYVGPDSEHSCGGA